MFSLGCRFSDQQRVDQPDGAVVGGHVLLRRVRGCGGRRVKHHEQLLGSVEITVLEAAPQVQTAPDLRIYGGIVFSSPGPWGIVTIGLSVGVRNSGDGEAAAPTLWYYRSTDATITTADTQVDLTPVLRKKSIQRPRWRIQAALGKVQTADPVVSKNTNELKTGSPGRFGIDVSTLDWPMGARILGHEHTGPALDLVGRRHRWLAPA